MSSVSNFSSSCYDRSLIECALSHKSIDELEECKQCTLKDQTTDNPQRIANALAIWHICPSIRQAIELSELKGRVTVLSLEYSHETYFMTESNLSALSSAKTAEPLIFGYSDRANSPYILIRFEDTPHNTDQNFPLKVKSFLSLSFAPIPQVGLKINLIESRFFNNPNKEESKYLLQNRKLLHELDEGKEIEYVTKLIKGEIEGKKIA